ncbi:MAG: hypothetical protein ABFS35_14745 [Bacteroidota bacterium]
MKTISLILILFVFILSGCTKDALPVMDKDVLGNNENELTNSTMKDVMAKDVNDFVTIPIHAELYGKRDLSLPPTICTPEIYEIIQAGGGWIGGFASLVGKVDEAKSRYLRTSCEFNPETYIVTSYNSGKITAINGDYYNFNAVGYVDVLTMTFTGEVTITGGTGRFDEAGGTVQMVDGMVDESGNTNWTGIGYMTLKKGKRN